MGEINKKPELSDFQLTEELVKEIEAYNKKQKEEQRKGESRKNMMSVLGGILFIGIPIFLFLYLGFFAIIVIIILIPIINWLGKDSDWFSEKRSYPLHPLSEKLEKYNIAKEYYRNKVSQEEYNKAYNIKEEELNKRRRQANYWFSLSGYDFEREVANILRKLGYNATRTRGSGDEGADVIVDDFDGKKIIIQCKAHKNPVGPNVIRELQGVVMHLKADKGVLISLGGYTIGVKKFKHNKELYLMNVMDIIGLQEGLYSGKWRFAGIDRSGIVLNPGILVRMLKNTLTEEKKEISANQDQRTAPVTSEKKTLKICQDCRKEYDTSLPHYCEKK